MNINYGFLLLILIILISFFVSIYSIIQLVKGTHHPVFVGVVLGSQILIVLMGGIMVYKTACTI